ncbi:hypothetical protein BDF21DRAFT_399540 [Thamnidium elegans]|nr:hypothetical protein BDF21DRAFT_399540 [Thamnidium elegans]
MGFYLTLILVTKKGPQDRLYVLAVIAIEDPIYMLDYIKPYRKYYLWTETKLCDNWFFSDGAIGEMLLSSATFVYRHVTGTIHSNGYAQLIVTRKVSGGRKHDQQIFSNLSSSDFGIRLDNRRCAMTILINDLFDKKFFYWVKRKHELMFRLYFAAGVIIISQELIYTYWTSPLNSGHDIYPNRICRTNCFWSLYMYILLQIYIN